AAVQEALAYTRARRGPAFIHAKGIRPYSHARSDDERLYKTPEERAEEATRDPIVRMAELLKSEGFASESELESMHKEIEREVNDAAETAIAAEKPARDTVLRYVYSPDIDPASTAFESAAAAEGKPDTMVAAINRTLKDEMARNPRIIVFGEDVADCSREAALECVPGKGGVFKVTHGLQGAFGSTRVYNAPLAEARIIGRAIGMATRGLKPVVEIQFFAYIWPERVHFRGEMCVMRLWA